MIASIRSRRTPLAVAFATALAATSLSPTQGMSAPDNTWVRIRSDPARRIFAQFPTRYSRSAPAPAATWPVVNCADSGAGSLRAAIGAAGDGDTIDLTALTCGTITLQTGAIPVRRNNLTLIGPGRSALTIDGNATDRVFIHPGRGTLTLRAMTIQNGRNRATGFNVAGGGCVASAAYVALEDATVRNCYAGGEGAYGGAIYAYSLTLSNSTLSGNVANGVHEDAGTAAFGGAAFVYQMQFTDSTVTGNRAEHRVKPGRTSYDIAGGVIAVRGGSIAGSTIDSNVSQGRAGGIAAFNSISVSNSTISGNVAASEIGGGLFLRWPATIDLGNSTITANHAEAGGGGIWLAMPSANLQSSIVFGNSTGGGQFAELQDPAALTISGGGNLIGTSGPNVALPAGTLNTDPLLGVLADNGGPTRTHALLRGSPAVDVGNNSANLSFDQRGAGYPRVYGAAADIGAFEQQALPFVQTPVPTLSQWMMALLAGLLAALASGTQARQRQRRDTRVDSRSSGVP
ncbi:IPTL-CTERM sorting domain-containing protein [Dokdonella soli]|uniref:IPTL-CTERM protein sorting domain-containing protein n=1 Tax=Dokdonella soli TaxID=529810 RepID=A0ABN1IKJ9_9GAMM